MMNSGSIEIADLLQQLSRLDTVTFRLALVRDATEWKVHTLVIEQFPREEADDVPVFNLDYDSAYFAAGLIGGGTAAEWLSHRVGEVRPPGAAGPVRRFALPEFVGQQVYWQRFASHAWFDFKAVSLPFTRYDVTGRGWTGLADPIGLLIADGCDVFPDFKTAVLRLAYEADDLTQAPSTTLTPAVIVRLADDHAWLNTIKLAPAAITVSVAGTGVAGTQLTFSGDYGQLLQQRLASPETVECPLPRGIPAVLHIVLSRGNTWLDRYYRDARYPLYQRNQANVVMEYGDMTTEIEALISQGEGPTVEFKEIIPADKDRMLKTVAAFANTDGGVILLGVENGTGRVVGVEREGHLIKDDITNMVRNRVYPEPTFRIEGYEIEHRQIIALYVDKGDAPPYGLGAAPPLCYIRRGATTFPARPEEIRAVVLASQWVPGIQAYQ